MRAFQLVKPQENETVNSEDILQNDKPKYFPESAEIRQRAINLGSAVFAVLIYGGLCANFGLILGTLITSGIICVLIPVGIFAWRKQHIWKPFYNERILGAKIPEIVPEFETDYQFIIMKDKLQLVAANQFPRFFNLQYVRIMFKGVPKGIMYNVAKHHWTLKNEFIELEISPEESFSKAWDKKLRTALLQNPNLETSVELHYQE